MVLELLSNVSLDVLMEDTSIKKVDKVPSIFSVEALFKYPHKFGFYSLLKFFKTQHYYNLKDRSVF